MTDNFEISFWTGNNPEPTLNNGQVEKVNYGGKFCGDWVILAVTSTNLNAALKNRVFGCREPKLFGYCEWLRTQQLDNIRNNHVLRRLWSSRVRQFDMWNHYIGRNDEMEEHHTDPHEKRNLRIDAWFDLSFGQQAQEHWARMVKIQLKPKEWAKMTSEGPKPPRTTMDLTTKGSLMGAIKISRYKECQAQDDFIFEIDGITARIIYAKAATFSRLKYCFEQLYVLTTDYVFLVFSDDCSAGWWKNGFRTWANIDISGCDRSHTDATFEFFRDTLPPEAQWEGQKLIEQCKLPIKIQPPELKSNKSTCPTVIMRPKQCMVYSGSVLTTPMNDIASTHIAWNVVKNKAKSKSEIQIAAESVGFIVTVQECEKFEDVQFLKQSPIFHNGEIFPFPNLGVWMRSSGTICGGLPGRDAPQEKFRRVQAALISCTYSRISTPIIEKARANYGAPLDKDIVQMRRERFHYDLEEGPLIIVPHASMMERYGPFLDEAEKYWDVGFGECVYSPNIALVLKKDYDYDETPVSSQGLDTGVRD